MILEEQNLRSSLESRLRPNWHYDFAQLKICFFSPWYLNPQQRLVFVVFNQMRLFTIPPTDSSRCESRFKWELPTSRLHLKVLFPKHYIWVKSLWTGERIEFSLERGHNIIISISFQFFRQSLLNIRREKARIRCNKKIVIFLAYLSFTSSVQILYQEPRLWRSLDMKPEHIFLPRGCFPANNSILQPFKLKSRLKLEFWFVYLHN